MSMFGSQSLQGGLVTLAEQRVTAAALQCSGMQSRLAALQCEPLPVARTTAATAIFQNYGWREGEHTVVGLVVVGRLTLS